MGAPATIAFCAPLERWRAHGEKPDHVVTFGGLPYTEDPASCAGSSVYGKPPNVNSPA